MKNKVFSMLYGFVILGFLLSPSVWAGYVVTEEVKQWAKNALEQEKKLDTIAAPNTVAVIYFKNKTEWAKFKPLEKGIAIMLLTDLSMVKGIHPVERIKLQALVEEMNLETNGLVDPEISSRLGRLLRAEHIIGGDLIAKKIDEFKVKSNVLKVPTEKILGQPEAAGKLIAEIIRMEKEILFDIVNLLKIELSAQQIKELKKPLTTDIDALFYFFEAVEYSDRGNYIKAHELYAKAIEKDPEFMVAQNAIGELNLMGIISEPPMAEAFEPPEEAVDTDLRLQGEEGGRLLQPPDPSSEI